MDTVEASNEFQDWELLHSNSDSESAHDSDKPSDEIDSGGLIQVDYFSLESHNRRFVEELDDGKSTQSDNPSWIDPGLEENPRRFVNKESAEFWSDSSSERSENERAYSENENREVGSEGIREIVERKGEKMEGVDKFYSDSSGTEVGSLKFNGLAENSEVGMEGNSNSHEKSEISGEFKSGNEEMGSGGEVIGASGNHRNGEIEKRGVVWWKMPMEFLKYCVFRMSPVWSVSVAAAVMGFLILGRRLYKMKKKARGLQIKVAVDDKKISQVMSRAARLNEAFSVVKRVPMIRPTMPAVGSTTWPAMSLR